MRSRLYDDEFYLRHGKQALESARIIVPIVMRLAAVSSVIDVGCGAGGWLQAFNENGVEAVYGVDGGHIDVSRLYVAPECFSAVDLTKRLNIKGAYDLAVCLEVAEHLDASSGIELVETLTRLAPITLFSAAIPGQGGIGHVNEQWPGYWRRLFQQRNFEMLDPIRPLIREDRRVDWWYRQNVLVFAAQAAIMANPLLRESSLSDSEEIEWVHVNMCDLLTQAYGTCSLICGRF